MLKRTVNADENTCMPTSDLKQQAHELIDSLDDSATWDEVAYHMEVRASNEQGLADIKAGRMHTHEEVRKHFGLDE